MLVNERECEEAGVPPREVANLARRLDAVGRELDRLGLTVFGGSGSGTLRRKNLILADLSHGQWDGGDGAYMHGADGLLRGESA